MCVHKEDFSHQVTLPLPAHIDITKETRSISCDLCCTHVIQHLWDNHIQTLSHCCGHGKINPLIVIHKDYGNDQIAEIYRLIKEVDPRDWELHQWRMQLIKV